MSRLVLDAIRSPCRSTPSWAQIDTLAQPATTCALVTRKPSSVTKKPVPLLTRPLVLPGTGGPAAEGRAIARASNPQQSAAAQTAAPALYCRLPRQLVSKNHLASRIRRRATRHPHLCSDEPTRWSRYCRRDPNRSG